MDKAVEESYLETVDKGQRCHSWLTLETTQEFLQPLKDKLKDLKEVSLEDIQSFDDKSFRSKVEAQFLAAKEIEDYFALLDDIVKSRQQAQDALEGKDGDTY